MNAYGYLYSTFDEDFVDRIEEFCEERGFKLIDVYRDTGLDGIPPLRERPAGAAFDAALSPGSCAVVGHYGFFDGASDLVATANAWLARGVDFAILSEGAEDSLGTLTSFDPECRGIIKSLAEDGIPTQGSPV
jgi:hypothetical protein